MTTTTTGIDGKTYERDEDGKLIGFEDKAATAPSVTVRKRVPIPVAVQAKVDEIEAIYKTKVREADEKAEAKLKTLTHECAAEVAKAETARAEATRTADLIHNKALSELSVARRAAHDKAERDYKGGCDCLETLRVETRGKIRAEHARLVDPVNARLTEETRKIQNNREAQHALAATVRRKALAEIREAEAKKSKLTPAPPPAETP